MYKYQKGDNVDEIFTFPVVNYSGGILKHY